MKEVVKETEGKRGDGGERGKILGLEEETMVEEEQRMAVFHIFMLDQF